MGRRGLGLAMVAALLLAGCTDEGSVPIYVGDNLLTTFGGPAGASAPTAVGAATAEPRSAGLTLGGIFASEGTPVYIGGRRINCPEDQPDC